MARKPAATDVIGEEGRDSSNVVGGVSNETQDPESSSIAEAKRKESDGSSNKDSLSVSEGSDVDPTFKPSCYLKMITSLGKRVDFEEDYNSLDSNDSDDSNDSAGPEGKRGRLWNLQR